ncbi:uncharacterized protein [Amphiura filiformis]|uniref:uncharacterized protein n=1 Tax=Amphiura filiformis TaxID=82378 RepID=UPI003B22284A
MADIDDIRKSARKRKPSRKLQGYYMTEKGQTVHMSAAGGVSCNENDDDDDNSWKVKATKRKEKPMEDIITNDEDEEEDQDDEEEDPKSEITLDDGPNLDWHILPGKGESSDDNAELYSGMHRATISILAEVHSASVPGYVSPTSSQQNLSNSSGLDSPTTSMISPVTSPNKNGCVVSREDKIIFHKRMYPGAPVRKSTRNQRGTFKKPADPQPQTDSGTSESQLSTCLAAGSSVVDSPVSDASISPACLTPDTSMNNMNVGVEKAKSDNIRGREHEDYTYIKQKTVTATDGEPEDNLVGDLHPRDSVSKSGSEACSELTDVLIDDPLNSGEGCEVNLVEAVSEKHQGACRDTPIDEASSLGMESDNVSKVSKEVETGEITCIENLKESSPSDKLDESDIIESLMNASLPRGTPNQSNETDIRDSEVNSSETSQARKNYESERFDDNETIAVQQNVAVQQSVGTEMDVEMLEHNASLNTSTEDFVSADEMPMELPHDNAKSQQEGVVDSMPCTPPMSPTMKNNHFEELRRSLTKDCKVMLTNTPTPPRQLANLKSKNNGGDKPTNDSDFDESFHSLDSDEEDQPKTVTRKKSQRRKSVKTLTEIMEEEDDDSDFPVASTKKKGFMSQFQRFLLLTKDLDDTPSDKGTPPAKAENIFQDSPATLLTKQLCSFSLETPVSKQITQDKRTNESSKRSVRKMDKTVKESSSSPLKRKHITSKVKESKQKMPKKKVKAVHNVKKEPLDAHDMVVVRTPERQKITFPPETPLTPLVNLAKKSDKSAMQEFFSPNKLEVKVINTPPKKFCRPVRVSLTSPKSAMQKYFSPDKLQVKVVNTPPKKFCSPVSVSLQSPVQSLMQHLSPHKYKVQIESPSTKVLQAVCNSKNFCVSLSKEEIQQIGQEDRRKSMTSEIENLGSKIEQVTLHSTKKKAEDQEIFSS